MSGTKGAVDGKSINRKLIISKVRLRFDTEAVTPMMHIIAGNKCKGVRSAPALKILIIGLIIGLGGFGSALAQEPGQRVN